MSKPNLLLLHVHLQQRCTTRGHASFDNEIFSRPHQMRNDRGATGTQFPGRRIPMGTPKSPNNVTSTFFNTVHLVPKDLRFEHGGVKLASCPGRHLISLRPWSTCSLKYEIWRRCWRIMKQNKSTSRKSIDTMRNNLDGDVTKS